MVTRDDITTAVHQILGEDLVARANKIDTNANGVQIEGREQVSKIAVGVSSSLDFFREAVHAGAQFCITHHGIHLDARFIYNSRFDLAQQAVLKFVFAHDLTVSAYHFALDAHPVIGNNAVIIRELGAKRLDIPYMMEGWGWVAEFDEPMKATDLAEKCSDLFGNDVFAVYAGPHMVNRIGVCSGGAKPVGEMLHEIHEKGVDVHITGEIGHSDIHIAKEAEFNYFAGGHYATEVFGVQELGKKLKEHFKNKVEVEFIEIPNPL